MPFMSLPEFSLYNLTFSYLTKILRHQHPIIWFNLGMIILIVMVLLVIIDLIAPYWKMHIFFHIT